uniref:Uncharacterized protein n=1 Tax=Caenorhabditis japonica TaxID=281687 RepID=A0A8R1HYG7_CAEJA
MYRPCTASEINFCNRAGALRSTENTEFDDFLNIYTLGEFTPVQIAAYIYHNNVCHKSETNEQFRRFYHILKDLDNVLTGLPKDLQTDPDPHQDEQTSICFHLDDKNPHEVVDSSKAFDETDNGYSDTLSDGMNSQEESERIEEYLDVSEEEDEVIMRPSWLPLNPMSGPIEIMEDGQGTSESTGSGRKRTRPNKYTPSY